MKNERVTMADTPSQRKVAVSGTGLRDLDDLKIKNPIEAVLADRGIHPIRTCGHQLLYLSPLREESNPSFYVHPTKGPGGVFFDFGLGEGGDVIRLVQLLERSTFKEAINYLIYRRSI